MATRMMLNQSSSMAARASSLLRCVCTEAKPVSEVAVAEQPAEMQRRGQGWPDRRLSVLSADGVPMGRMLDEHTREGKVIKKYELENCMHGRYDHALQVMEWMEKRNVNFSNSNFAVHLDLISKVNGIAAAENYFDGLSPSNKNQHTYGALLNCYCKGKLEDKALALFQEMDRLDIASNNLAFTNLMLLYVRKGQPEKVSLLVQEMKNRNIPLTTYTYNIWMLSYWHLEDIEGVERVYKEIQEKNKCDWMTYCNLAVVYVNTHLHEKAAAALKKLEEEMGPPNRDAYYYLISLNAKISNLGEVHRIWNALKAHFKVVTNVNYLIVIQALAKLNDIDGIKKYFEEWESTCSLYDMRLANVAIGAYLKHDMIEDAESVLHHAIERSRGPFFTAWEMIMVFYLTKHQIDSALKCMKTAMDAVNENNQWHPEDEITRKFLEYFMEEKDVDGAEEFCQGLKKLNCLDSKAYELLLQIYVAAGKTAPGMRARIEGDGIEINYALGSLLTEVCPE